MHMKKKVYRSRLIINLNDSHLVSVCSEIEVMINNPVLTYNLQKE